MQAVDQFKRPIANASVVVLGDEASADGELLQIPAGPVTLPVLYSYFQLLYGDPGKRILSYFQQANGEIELGDVLFDLDLDRVGSPVHSLIQIEEDISPIQAAQYLYVGLLQAMAYSEVRIVITQAEDIDALKAAYKAQVTEAAKIVATGAEGQYYAAIGFLPFVSGRMATGAEVVLKRVNGTVIGRFDKATVDALALAATKNTVAEQFDVLGTLLTVDERLGLVKAGIIRVRNSRPNMRAIMEGAGIPAPAHLRNPQVHHDLLFHLRRWFAAPGLDVNKPEYLRWVEGTPPGQHQHWTPEFNSQWQAMLEVEPMNTTGFTKQQILAQLQGMRLSGDFD